MGQESLPGTSGTELRLAKSRILLGDIRKMAWNAQCNVLRREERTEGRRKGYRQTETLTVRGPGHWTWSMTGVLERVLSLRRRDGQK